MQAIVKFCQWESFRLNLSITFDCALCVNPYSIPLITWWWVHVRIYLCSQCSSTVFLFYYWTEYISHSSACGEPTSGMRRWLSSWQEAGLGRPQGKMFIFGSLCGGRLRSRGHWAVDDFGRQLRPRQKGLVFQGPSTSRALKAWPWPATSWSCLSADREERGARRILKAAVTNAERS